MRRIHSGKNTRLCGRCISALVLVVLLVPTGCRKEEQMEQVELPSTPVLTLRSNWALVTSSHLRLRESPTVDSAAVATLWEGYVLEVVSRGSRREVADEKTDYWYQIRYDGLHGWVFGAYLQIFDTRARAEQASRDRNR